MNEELAQIIRSIEAIAADAEGHFRQLNGDQLNWKPKADEWSIAQCFDHLMVTNAGYFPLIKKIVSGEYKPSFQERIPLLPRFFGSAILKVVQPQSQRKFKAIKAFEPSSSSLGDDIIIRFCRHQQELTDHMRLTERLDLRKIVITSPVASIATYSLLDAFKIVVAHEQRHLAQAKRLMEREGFPTSIRSVAAEG